MSSLQPLSHPFAQIKNQLLAQQQALQNAEQQLNLRAARLTMIDNGIKSNQKNLARIGLSRQPPVFVSLSENIYSVAFSFLSIRDLGRANCVSKTWKKIITEYSFMENALIIKISMSNPLRAVELSMALPATKRLLLLQKRAEQSGETFDVAAESCKVLTEIVKAEATAVAILGAIIVGPLLPAPTGSIDDMLGLI